MSLAKHGDIKVIHVLSGTPQYVLSGTPNGRIYVLSGTPTLYIIKYLFKY